MTKEKKTIRMPCPFCGGGEMKLENRVCEKCGHELDSDVFMRMIIIHLFRIVDKLTEEDVYDIKW